MNRDTTGKLPTGAVNAVCNQTWLYLGSGRSMPDARGLQFAVTAARRNEYWIDNCDDYNLVIVEVHTIEE